MKIKEPLDLQIQVEAFGDKSVKNFSEDQNKLLKYSAQLGKIKDLNNLPEGLPQDLAELIERNRQDYINFLRQNKKEGMVFSKENAEYYKKTFQPAVLALKEKIKGGDFKTLPEYLGSGSNGHAFRIEINGQSYAVKFPTTAAQANFELKPLIQAKGIEHTAQLAAFSFEDGVTIMELLPGTVVTNLDPESTPEYPDEHIIQLINMVQELNNKGLVIDPKASNFLYDKKEGFSVLDFHLKKPGNKHYTFEDSIMSLKLALTARNWPKIDPSTPDFQRKSKEQNVEESRIFLSLMVRFLTILKNKFPGILEKWNEQMAERKRDKKIRNTPLIDRENIYVDHPELAVYLKQLEEMGF